MAISIPGLLFLGSIRGPNLVERCRHLRRGMTREEVVALLGQPSSVDDGYCHSKTPRGVEPKKLIWIEERWDHSDVYVVVLYDPPEYVYGYWVCRKSRTFFTVVLPEQIRQWMGLPEEPLDFSNTLHEG